MSRIVSEQEFSIAINNELRSEIYDQVDCVIGPGRSGAVAAVYASHILSVPFLPYGAKVPEGFSNVLIIDTATESGKTLKKCANKYKDALFKAIAIYNEPPRVAFWYEAPKPQRYRKETK